MLRLLPAFVYNRVIKLTPAKPHSALYLQRLINIVVLQVFSEYFKELEEESIRDNFVIIYELMDELMDFGYPQTTDSKILQE